MTRRVIHLYPCVDALLYAPIYLAIASFNYRDNTVPRLEPKIHYRRANGDQRVIDRTEWSFDGELTIYLHRAATDGDRGNYARVKQCAPNSASEIHIAIGDPLDALFQPPDRHSREFQIIATFANRIALWGVLHKAGKQTSDFKRHCAALVELSKKGYMPLFPRDKQFSHLRLGYCTKGASTSVIVKTFISRAFAPIDNMPNEMGLMELKGLGSDYDITFSFEPWLVNVLDNETDITPYETIPWFQSVPYPFSSLVMYGTDDEIKSSKELLVEFIQHCEIGLAMFHRHKSESIRKLKQMASYLRNFGLPNDALDHPDINDRIVNAAISQLVHSDCFCEGLENSWVAWELGFQAYHEACADHEINIETMFNKIKSSEHMRQDFDYAELGFTSEKFKDILNNMSDKV